MTTEIERIIEAPAAAVWDLLVDTERWPEWGPTVAEVRCDTRRIEHGSTGSVKLPIGLWVDFRITEFVPGRRWSWKVARVPATGHFVEELGPERCRATITLPSRLAAPYAWVCGRGLEAIERLVRSEDVGA